VRSHIHGGPPPGACRCWHARADHPTRCHADGCRCRRFVPNALSVILTLRVWIYALRSAS
jgi:hypothetical protein